MKLGTKYFFLFLVLFHLAVFSIPAECKDTPEEIPQLLIFHSVTCHSCVKVKLEVMPAIEKEFQGKISIKYLDIADMENYKMLVALQTKYDPKNTRNALPVIFIKGKFLYGEPEVKKDLRNLIIASLENKQLVGHESTQVDLMSIFQGFKPLVVIGAGLLDGINPCAFTVIVFFISFLALQGYRKRELTAIGLTFIFAVFITYLLIGLGLFAFLYRLEGFWLVSRIVDKVVGLFSIALGCLALYDFFKFKETGETEGLILQLPRVIKNRIHSVIGTHYRAKVSQGIPPARKNIWGLVLSALITGFLVSVLESVCTGQTYLPTIVFILKTAQKFRAFAYLLLYNFMFVVPLFVIFLFALFGATSEGFSKFLKRHLLTVKILMVLLFFGLGIWLLIGRG